MFHRCRRRRRLLTGPHRLPRDIASAANKRLTVPITKKVRKVDKDTETAANQFETQSVAMRRQMTDWNSTSEKYQSGPACHCRHTRQLLTKRQQRALSRRMISMLQRNDDTRKVEALHHQSWFHGTVNRVNLTTSTNPCRLRLERPQRTRNR